MSTNEQLNEFAMLFKQYRLRAGIATLKEFQELLAKENIFYDISLFTRWQKGERIPHDRTTIMAILRIFVKKGGMSMAKDMHALMNAVGEANVTEKELAELSRIQYKKTTLIPSSISDFVGREALLKDISWQLLHNDIVGIYGSPGVGKTSFAIHLGHILQSFFKDGVLYYRSDIQYEENILVDIARYLGEDISQIKKITDKLSYLQSLLNNKQILIILDNIENYDDVRPLVEGLRAYAKLLLVSQYKPPAYRNSFCSYVPSFSEDEALLLAAHKLGNRYVTKHRQSLLQLATLTGNSPLALSILLSYIFRRKVPVEQVIKRIDTLLPIAYKRKYDNKTIASSLELTTNTLDKLTKEVFMSFAMVSGKDISAEAMAAVHKISIPQARTVLTKLTQLSLVEQGKDNRYQVHPLIKLYLKQRTIPEIWYERLARYYIDLQNIEPEADSIRAVFNYCNERKLYNYTIDIWNHIAVFLFTNGRWEDITEYQKALQTSSRQDRKNKQIILLITIFFVVLGLVTMLYRPSVLFTYSYWLVAGYGALIGLKIATKWGFLNNSMGKAILFFSLGLFAQTFGQVYYAYLYAISGSNELLYPSFGDIGYFGSIPLYIIGTIFLAQAAGIQVGLKSFKSKVQTLIIPVAMLILSYIIFLKGYKLNLIQPLKILLDFGYPLGQAIYISLVILIFLLSRKTLGGVMKRGVLYILSALFVQYIADFSFLYQVSRDQWAAPIDITDFIYLLAYGIMAFALLQFDYTRKPLPKVEDK